jgi:hypothetical protein
VNINGHDVELGIYFLLFLSRNRMLLNFEILSYLCVLTEDVDPIYYVTGLELHTSNKLHDPSI